MKRSLIAAALLVACAMASAQTYNPKIAYTGFASNAGNLYLANADGSNAVIVYKANKVRLGAIDLAPVSAAAPSTGRVAFVESGILKVLGYTVSASAIHVTGVTTLDATGAPYQGAGDPDFSPDGNQLLYTRAEFSTLFQGVVPTEIRLIPATGGPSALLVRKADSSLYITHPRWLRAEAGMGPAFVYMLGRPAGEPSTMDVRLAFLDAGNAVVEPPTTLFNLSSPGFPGQGVEDMDVARTGNGLLLSVNRTSSAGGGSSFVEYDIDADSFVTRAVGERWRGHFSAGDARIISVDRGKGYGPGAYVWSQEVATGVVKAIAKKGAYDYTDAQP